jgi:hypothetical protein
MWKPPVQRRDVSCESGLNEFLERVGRARIVGLDEIIGTDLYYRKRRHGVHVDVVRSGGLNAAQVRCLTEYRIAQYLRIGFVDTARVVGLVESGSPLSRSADDDVHVVASTGDGQILCAAILRTLPDVGARVRMSERDRSLFPVEEVYGSGVFNGLRVLPDLPVARIRELGGFVKNWGRGPVQELTIRAPVEVGVALFRVISGPLALPIDAVIGDLEDSVAKLNLEFFGVRPVLVTGTAPYVSPSSYLGPRYQDRNVQPFAILTSDISTALPRLSDVDAALDRPGPPDLLGLFKSLQICDWSTLADDNDNVHVQYQETARRSA